MALVCIHDFDSPAAANGSPFGEGVKGHYSWQAEPQRDPGAQLFRGLGDDLDVKLGACTPPRLAPQTAGHVCPPPPNPIFTLPPTLDLHPPSE